MNTRLATVADLDDIMRIYDTARQTMRATGNHTQWLNGYPQIELIQSDIAQGKSYVICDDDNMPHAVFMFAIGDDPTYGVIEEGAWLNDEPYGVIHRIASDGQLRGIIPTAVKFGAQRIDNLRIDTHADNVIMHHVLAKAGFKKCGIIYCQDGTPRIAYQRTA